MITKFIQAAILCSLCSGALAQELRLTFSDRQETGTRKVYGTVKSNNPPTVSTRAGHQVVVTKQSGRDFQLQALPQGQAFFGTGVQQLPRDAIRLSITPKLDDQTVSLEIQYHQKQGDDILEYSSTVGGKLGEWIPLLSNRAPTATGSKSWTAGQAPEQLSVKVDPL